MEEYNFEKLAREIVTSRQKDINMAPGLAAEIAKQMIITGFQSTNVRQDPHLTVSAVCRGVMGGMLLIREGKGLPQTAVSILREMPNISHEVPIETADLMTWGMEGIASVALLVGFGMQNSIQEAIEEHFMGAGVVFSELCRKVSSKKPAA